MISDMLNKMIQSNKHTCSSYASAKEYTREQMPLYFQLHSYTTQKDLGLICRCNTKEDMKLLTVKHLLIIC